LLNVAEFDWGRKRTGGSGKRKVRIFLLEKLGPQKREKELGTGGQKRGQRVTCKKRKRGSARKRGGIACDVGTKRGGGGAMWGKKGGEKKKTGKEKK